MEGGGLAAAVGMVERFAVIAGGEEVSAHKPDPGVYLLHWSGWVSMLRMRLRSRTHCTG